MIFIKRDNREVNKRKLTINDWFEERHELYYGKEFPWEDKTLYDELNSSSESRRYHYAPPNISRWDPNETHWSRQGRFPSVEDRIRFYMGRWYDPPTNNQSLFDEEFHHITKEYKHRTDQLGWPDMKMIPLLNPLELNPRFIYDCRKMIFPALACREQEFYSDLFRFYLEELITIAVLHVNKSAPVLVHFFDGTTQTNEVIDHSYPVFGKVRDMIAEENESHQRYESRSGCVRCGEQHSTIIWPFNYKRHFSIVAEVPLLDIPWEEKEGMLVYRGGAHTGTDFPETITFFPIEISSFKQRLALIENHLNSSFVDAKFISENQYTSEEFIDEPLDLREQLKFKYLLSIEGNDVSSGLKWMLFSNSVVFCPPFTFASWAIEPFLEPFVHYIPVHANMSNVEEMVMWAENHQSEAKRIAERSTLFMFDMLFHPDAYRDELLVLSGIMNRYEQNFGVTDTRN